MWGPLELWGCYCGLRPVPLAFAAAPAPAISECQTAALCARWRRLLQTLIKEHQLDPATALERLTALAPEEHRRDFYAVLTGFRRYRPAELAVLWKSGDRYLPEQWLAQWCDALPATKAAVA